jgi:lipopolysaccharide/colanic/teichoic acid biosynthesis glycosyltransferase
VNGVLVPSGFIRPAAGQRLTTRLRFQFATVGLTAMLLPLVMPLMLSGHFDTSLAGTRISQLASLIAAEVALLAFRRVTAYPGTSGFAYIIPAFSITFGIATAILLGLRLSYSGSMLLTGYLACIAVMFVLWYIGNRSAPLQMYIVPSGNTSIMADTPQVEWVPLTEPRLPEGWDGAIVADLRWDHHPEWERLLAEAAISGRPVYHTKQLHESLTGRVEIEHLSENSFGSLLPNRAYHGIKRAGDLLACLVLLPILALPMLVVAILVQRDSSGPALFRQERMGFRGQPFRVLKFRTMIDAAAGADGGERNLAITLTDDERITRLGRFLRRTRIDELPQIINVLRGEMSWIGPRPEAMALSRWYETELPFYVYRHIVRPGITGWAQVNQGHVAELDDVNVKLHYDFYYIKHFSAWLDMLIAMRTCATILTGFGAR